MQSLSKKQLFTGLRLRCPACPRASPCRRRVGCRRSPGWDCRCRRPVSQVPRSQSPSRTNGHSSRKSDHRRCRHCTHSTLRTTRIQVFYNFICLSLITLVSRKFITTKRKRRYKGRINNIPIGKKTVLILKFLCFDAKLFAFELTRKIAGVFWMHKYTLLFIL